MLKVQADIYNAKSIVDLISKYHEAMLQDRHEEALEILHRLLDWLSPSQIRKLAPAIIRLEDMLEGVAPIRKEEIFRLQSLICGEIHRRGWFE